jgi:transcriptional regulator with XRE-family HTH domain
VKAERRSRGAARTDPAGAVAPRKTPRPPDSNDPTHAASQQWLRAFGRHLRDVREVLGLSQPQLSRLAGVSLAMLTRLEAGHGPTTPLLSVLKLEQVLGAKLAEVDPAWLAQELPHHVRVAELLGLLTEDRPVAADLGVEEITHLHHRTPARQRRQLLAIVRTAADGLKTSDD